MKNLKRNVSTAWALIIILVLAVVVGAYVHTASKRGWDLMNISENIKNLGTDGASNTNGTGGTNTPNQPGGATGTGNATVSGEGYSVTYPASQALQVKMTESLYNDLKGQYAADTLISSTRYNQLGETKCYYGQSGNVSECRIEKESRLSFFAINESLNDLTEGIDATLLTSVTVDGVKSVLLRVGAEGEGIDQYFIPLAHNRTLVIKRSYNDSTTFPTKAQVDQFIASINITAE